MKKLIAITGALLVAYVILSASVTGRTGVSADDGAGAEDTAVYVMLEEDDRVAVYRDGDLYLRTDTRVSTLPKSDRRKLKEGITVFSVEELKRLIEDICS